MKVVSLFSGGLDSILSVCLLRLKDIDIFGLYIQTPFNSSEFDRANKAAFDLRIPLKLVQVNNDYIDMVLSPEFGYGKNMNPCIDCKIFMYRLAKRYLEELSAEFIITGEVLGERPMSQNRNILLLMDKRAGCTGLILRPLSAKLLPPTIAEDKGLVDRVRLCGISGRSRKPQIELADLLGISIIPVSAGGCLLTDPCFSKRLKESIEHGEKVPLSLELLSVGRHFRLPAGEKLIVSRNNRERERLIKAANKDYTILESEATVGLLNGKKNIRLAAAIVSHYSSVKRVYYRADTEESWVDPQEITHLSVSNYRL